MDRDLLFLVGLVFLPLAFVALVSAWADRRRPWAALILVAVGLGVAAWASFTNPAGPYDWRLIPELAVETVGRYWQR
ncbi:hypothetical protein [Pararhodobacter aggregans]|uniref:Uncharacterized protein n=1 Tax=Pararhodobacter aggregans TaxID=404875 RepID=A0A2T7UM04_9RHOB|nr:hypothetical protein [Pararhodobacter aggregans]PTX02194.1 hypothetical protein C8N33_10513 [Pararhodobacter aggregans]PVE45651.1 hypothetical protein DDE23_20540 [Pararhodobacter aggregans]